MIHQLQLKDAPQLPVMQKLEWEKELLGVYVSGHPLDEVSSETEKRPTIAQVRGGYKGTTVVTTGLIESVRELITKKGDKMAFIKLADQSDSIELTAFPGVFEEQRELIVPGTCVAVKGKLDIRNDEPSILVDRLKNISKESVDTATVAR